MAGKLGIFAAGVGALGAAGVAAFLSFSPQQADAPMPAPVVEPSFTICLKSDLILFEGVEKGCYDQAQIARLEDMEVLDNRAEAVTVVLTDPNDHSATVENCTTCREYRAQRGRGRYAASSHDMRREAFFVRACGVLTLLFDARPAKNSFFTQGRPTLDEMSALGWAKMPRIGVDDSGSERDVQVEKSSDFEWILTSDEQRSILQEVANADFDADGNEEILFFAYARQQNGTAMIFSIGLLEKDTDGRIVVLKPLTFQS